MLANLFLSCVIASQLWLRRKATIPILLSDSSQEGGDPLRNEVLTTKVYTQCFEIFQQHFATDLPFLHETQFLKRLRQATSQSSLAESSDAQISRSALAPLSRPFLLAFLTLTSPFQSDLVSYYDPPSTSRSKSNPLKAANILADETRKALGDQSLGKPTLESTQALLMLGLHEWRMCQGAKCWQTIGTAIRCAQALGLQYEEDLDTMPEACLDSLASRDIRFDHLSSIGVGSTPSGRGLQVSKEDSAIKEEVNRRTMWSCFIMDRYLSTGKNRPQMLNAGDLRIQLPCSDRAFIFGRNVKAMMLREEEAEFMKRVSSPSHTNGNGAQRDHNSKHSGVNDVILEYDSSESTLSQFIRALDYYGDVVKWTCTGARRRDCHHPPWREESEFFQLEKKLQRLKGKLPNDLTLSQARAESHIASRTYRDYVLLHTVYTLCHIALYREHMPFLPFRCTKPEGPRDGPTFTEEQLIDLPPNYWEDNARKCFKSAREYLDLECVCQGWDMLVETPLTGFANYHVLVCVLYSIYFPQMDQDDYLKSRGRHSEAMDKSYKILILLKGRLMMSRNWEQTLSGLQKVLRQKKGEYRALVGSPTSSSSSGNEQQLPMMGEGGFGLREYLDFEKDLKEFGSIQEERYVDYDGDQDAEMMDGDGPVLFSAQGGQQLEQGSECSPHRVKSEDAETTEDTPDSTSVPQARFNAVNSSTAPAKSLGNGTSSTTNGSPAYSPRSNHAPTPEGHKDSHAPSGSHHQAFMPQYAPATGTDPAQRASLPLQHQPAFPASPMAPLTDAQKMAALRGWENMDFVTTGEFQGFAHGSDMFDMTQNMSQEPNAWMAQAWQIQAMYDPSSATYPAYQG
ncbi:fungal-specific transcription factor domain-containing protein [Massariosphaeria phaeospora]|uniref:Fungal-specific transcription factor domain-containing protein n=1 Tax=Massariosphaeria phaeospora TaxID=100035 RepID=A0A7C8I3C4_9PLEO|nr:fungal-specific transcription factor domain-containing protein [Massariosphaeria phaeospora]